MSDYASVLRALLARKDLDRETMRAAIGAIMDGTWTPAQTGAMLAALASKRESTTELVGAAEAMRERGIHVDHDEALVLDTCGTGGDGAGTINISTAVAFVVAGAGLPVAKHGNRSASSRCGSADVLEASGIAIDADAARAREHLRRHRFTFLFAPIYHPAMRMVAPIRRELGVRTVFNLLGPLTNPAKATHQVVGVAHREHVEPVGEALVHLGARAGAVVHSESGLDEVAGEGPTHVFQFGPRGARTYVLDPADLGIAAPREALAGGDAAFNATAMLDILRGERSPRADVVALNAALALLVAERAGSLREGLAIARRSLVDGAALGVFEGLRGTIPMECA